MSTRTEFNDEDLPPVLRRLIAEGRLRDYVLIELYVTLPLSAERLVQLRVLDLKRSAAQPEQLFVEHRGKTRRVHLDDEGLFTIASWIKLAGLQPQDYLFPSGKHAHGHLCSRQARRIIEAQFHSPPESGGDGRTPHWQDALGGGFQCRFSRWPWVDCVNAHSGDRCTTHCEGTPALRHPRSFRMRGVLPVRGSGKH